MPLGRCAWAGDSCDHAAPQRPGRHGFSGLCPGTKPPPLHARPNVPSITSPTERVPPELPPSLSVDHTRHRKDWVRQNWVRQSGMRTAHLNHGIWGPLPVLLTGVASASVGDAEATGRSQSHVPRSRDSTNVGQVPRSSLRVFRGGPSRPSALSYGMSRNTSTTMSPQPSASLPPPASTVSSPAVRI